MRRQQPITGPDSFSPDGRRGRSVVGRDPYIGMKWWVEVDNLIVATFSECSGLTIETEFHEYREGGVNTYLRKFPGPTKYQHLVLKRGMTDNPNLWNWYLDVVRLGQQAKQIRKSVHVRLFDYQSDRPVQTWSFLQAFPVKWIGPELRADAAAVAIETLEFAHEGLSLT